jgi:hypothetical protein
VYNLKTKQISFVFDIPFQDGFSPVIPGSFGSFFYYLLDPDVQCLDTCSPEADFNGFGQFMGGCLVK